MDRVATILTEENPWWQSSAARLRALPYRRQPGFARIRARLFTGDRRRGQLLIGMRWVGKTELVKQVAAAALDEGLPGHQLAFVRVDEPRLRGSLSIDAVLEAWDPWRRKDAPALLVIDEAHRLADPTPDGRWGWARQLKGVVDAGPIHVLATGSDAGRLLEGGGEGAGRWEYIELEPLSFREFRELRAGATGAPLDSTQVEDFETYLTIGGFPGLTASLAGRHELDGIQQYAKEVLLDELGGVREIAKVEQAFAILMDMSGSSLDVSSLSKSVGAKAETIERWLSALESVRLIQRIPRVRRADRSKLHVARGQQKVYGTDPGLVAAFSRRANPLDDAKSLGSLYEAAVLRHLRQVTRERGPRAVIQCLQITRGRRKTEVDFVLFDGDDEMFLVEVTSGGAQIDEKARLLRELAGDPAVCGKRRVFGLVVGPERAPTTKAGVPILGAARFLETLIAPEPGDDPLSPLRSASAMMAGE